MFPLILPWNDSTSNATDLSALVARNIDLEGYVTVTAAGHFAVNSGRIKFWGTNTAFGANFPSKANATQVAARLAKFGFNIVRLHHMDMYDIWTTTNPDRDIDPAKLDLLDYFIYSLKQKGVYADINLVVSRPFNRGSDLPADINLITDWKVRDALGYFDPQTRQLQKKYAYDLLTHVNTYTGNAYINEPSIALIEINNENGLTQAYLSRQLDALPAYYSGLLNTQWNAWLKTKYGTQSALSTAWGGGVTPNGPEKIINGNFSTGPGSEWHLEVIAPAAAAGAVTAEGAGTGYPNDYRINIMTAEPANTWHVQFIQTNLDVQTGRAYTLSFWAKADTARVMNVNIMQTNSPWANLGFSVNVNLTTAWQHYTYVTMVNANEANARVTFSALASATGTVWITGVSFAEGGSLGFYPGEDLDTNTIRNFLQEGETILRTDNSKKDWFRFLQETETAYWLDMRDYVKNTLGAHAIVFGTIVGCSTPNVQAGLDAIDTHTYWKHPSFPGTSWSATDWYVENYPMVNNQQGSTVAGIGVKAVLNRPHLVTEYNHPSPNTYESEAMFFLSTYGSLQDWDAVFPFDYNGSDLWNSGRIDGYFDVNQNPVKMASMIPCALAFYRGDISPAAQTVVVPINAEEEISRLLNTWAWQLVDAATEGENTKSTLIHKVRIAVEGQNVPGGSIAPGTTNTSGNVMTSDTGQITWDMSNTSAGFVKVDTAMTKMVYGFQAGRTYYLSGVTITPGATLAAGFSSIAVSALDGNSFASAQHILVTALGGQYNTGAQFYTYPNTPVTYPPAMNTNVTLRDLWGVSPSMVEGIPAAITLPCAYADTRVWALNATGGRGTAVPVVNSGGFASFSIDPSYNAVWYEVAVTQPEYTPSATATDLPVYSATATPTITITSTPIATLTRTASSTVTQSVTGTGTLTGTATPTITENGTFLPTPLSTGSVSNTPTITKTETITGTDTVTPTVVETLSKTVTHMDTVTVTRTLTATNTTPIVSSNTVTPFFTQTVTHITTNTPGPFTGASNTATPTPTQMPVSGILEIVDVRVFPHPYNPGKDDLKISFHTGADLAGVKVKIFTVGFRLINTFEAGTWPAGIVEFTVDRKYLVKLANGTYFYAISASDSQGREAHSKPGCLIIIK
ncbi:MAG: carbohydrate binding domain-containing protein [Spirochaetia bacterium]|nr:carbohydrate binding domain-containing protein [Spirochaetia bacterium]